ncbi:MAG: phytanoyl-CoA dioxygenase family protein [Acidimicrobiales bacterium]
MVTVDFRTRFEGDEVALDPATFLDDRVPALLDAHDAEAGRAAGRLGLAPLTLDVEGEEVTFEVTDGGRLVVHAGNGAPLVVALDRDAFSDLMQDVASTFGLQLTGRAHIRRGTLGAFVEWEPVLRCFLDGRPDHEPGSIRLADRTGAPLDLHQSFTLDSPREDIGHFLAEAGYLHIAGVFSEAEMAAVSAELDDAIASAERDDGASWWARTGAGEWYAARILGFNQKSPTLRELLHTERFATIGTVTDDRFVQRDPDIGDSAEGLLKKIDVVEGISDVSWHKDCSPGGHSRHCCGLTVGISVTGGGRENGELGVVAGSHRANIAPLGVEGLDLPRVPLPTHTGDVTVHCSCTLHMSRQPVSAERRVVYTGFGLAPRPGDHRVGLDPEEIRRQRAALNDHVRSQQYQAAGGARVSSYEL